MLDIRVGTIVRILPEFYLTHSPLPWGVVERMSDCPPNFLVGFPLYVTKLWMSPYDVEVVGTVEGDPQ